jgi:hypothetical protein
MTSTLEWAHSVITGCIAATIVVIEHRALIDIYQKIFVKRMAN